MKRELNSNLVAYIEEKYFPIYKTFDKGHDLNHIEEVITRVFEIAKYVPDIDINIAYASAALHDIGIQVQRKNHAFYSGCIVSKDSGLNAFFDESEIQIIKEAVEDHSTSCGIEPRSIYGKIVCDADKDNDLERSLTRAYEFTLSYFPEYTQEQCLENVYEQLNFKFGNHGKVRFWIGTPEQYEFMNKMKNIANNKELFTEIMQPIIKKCNSSVSYIKAKKD